MRAGMIVYIATAVFFAALGLWYSRGKRWSVEQFISSKNSLKLGATVATIFASSMGSWIMFSPAETMITTGIVALAGYMAGSTLSVWVFTWIGRKLRSLMPEGHTLIEYVLLRFGSAKYYFVLAGTLFFMALATTAELTGISLAGRVVFGIPLWVSAAVIMVAVLLYVLLGGFMVTVFTDRIQTWFILPLFAILIAGLFSSSGNVVARAAELSPALFDPRAGWGFALTLVIAIVCAEMFNQSWWQRVYAARDETVMRRGFFSAGLLVMPVVFIAGLLGLAALGTDAAADPSVALFAALLHMPGWLLTVGMVLAMTLVMSSIDTYLNAMVNVFTVDLARLLPGTARRKVLGYAQVFVFLLALVAGYVASRGMSVLYIFLLADLIMTAMVFPVFYGMYQARLGGTAALVAAILGLVGGLALFPDPSWSSGNLLHSFLAAFAVPAVLCLILARGERFDFGRLKARVKELN